MDGDALASMVGSWVSHYALWCYLQLSIFVFGGILGLVMLLYLPETASWGLCAMPIATVLQVLCDR
ncbi:hypothetical protein B0H13DRAFT_2358238 [Mycena leptocephala]|nr:hypothetical protein B0H13DRAFT_2358238 [Mycena leptocephala]